MMVVCKMIMATIIILLLSISFKSYLFCIDAVWAYGMYILFLQIMVFSMLMAFSEYSTGFLSECFYFIKSVTAGYSMQSDDFSYIKSRTYLRSIVAQLP